MNLLRSPMCHAGRSSATNSVIDASRGSARSLPFGAPSSAMNTTSRNSQRSRPGLRKYDASRSGPKSVVVNPDATVASTVTSTPPSPPSCRSRGVALADSLARIVSAAPRQHPPIVISVSSGTARQSEISASASTDSPRASASASHPARTPTSRAHSARVPTPAITAPKPSARRTGAHAKIASRSTAAPLSPIAAIVHAHPTHNAAASTHTAHWTSGCGLHARARAAWKCVCICMGRFPNTFKNDAAYEL